MSTESTGTCITGRDEAALWRTTRAFLLCFKDNTILFCYCQKSCCFCCYPRQDHWQLWELAYALVGRFGSTWDPLHPGSSARLRNVNDGQDLLAGSMKPITWSGIFIHTWPTKGFGLDFIGRVVKGCMLYPDIQDSKPSPPVIANSWGAEWVLDARNLMLQWN